MDKESSNQMTIALSGLAIPLFMPPSREDVDEGGQYLFENFVREEFEYEGIGNPPIGVSQFEAGDSLHVSQQFHSFNYSDSTDSQGSMSNGTSTFNQNEHARSNSYKHDSWTRQGKSLRELADQFAQSREGQAVRRQANEVTLRNITQDQFSNLLSELFHDGLSMERVIALFYFCSMLIVRAVKEQYTGLTKLLFTWSLRFIRDRVCQWVYENGGWEKVFSNLYTVLFRVGVISLIFVGIACGYVYIRNNYWR